MEIKTEIKTETKFELKTSLNRLSGKVALLTGASRGIGLSIAHVFAHEGASVIIADIDEAASAAAVRQLRADGLRADSIPANLLEMRECERVVRQIVEKFGNVDILVNNARTGRRSDMETQDLDSWTSEIDLMLKTTFHLSRLVIEAMKGEGNGAILNISSVAASLTVPESPAYHAAKGGVESLTRYLATQAGKYGVRVNALTPGHVLKSESQAQTPAWLPFLKKLIPTGRVPSSQDLGYTALFLCSEEASAITGQCIVADGGLSLLEQAQVVRQAGQDNTGPKII